MKLLWILPVCFCMIMLTACKEEQQKPEAGISTQENALEASSKSPLSQKRELNLTVHHHIKNEKVFVECIVTPNFQFTDDKTSKNYGEGKLYVFLDDKKVAAYTQGAFILEDIPKGSHTITIKLMHNDESEYGLAKSFQVEL